MMDVKLNGESIAQYAKVLDIRRDLIAPRSINVLTIPGMKGSHYAGKKIEARTFEVELMFIGDFDADRDSLARLLAVDEPAFLEFSDRPGIFYKGLPTGETVIQYEAKTGRLTIAFLIFSEHGDGASASFTIASTSPDGIVTPVVNGDAPTHPVLSVDFVQDSTFFAVTNGTQYLQLGRSETVEKPKQPRRELLLNDDASTTTGWTPLSGALMDTASLDGTIVSNGYSFKLGDEGSGAAWHGAAMAKSLGTTAQDFEMNARVILKTPYLGTAESMGKLDILFRNASGTVIGRITLKDDSYGESIGTARATIGQQASETTILESRHSKTTEFHGNLIMAREGDRVRVQWVRLDDDGNYEWSASRSMTDVAGKFDEPIASVVVMLAAYGSRPAASMNIEHIRFYKINTFDPETATDSAFKAGDELRIDMRNGSVLLNGAKAVHLVRPGSRFFSLRPGANTIAVTPLATVNATFSYTEKYH